MCTYFTLTYTCSHTTTSHRCPRSTILVPDPNDPTGPPIQHIRGCDNKFYLGGTLNEACVGCKMARGARPGIETGLDRWAEWGEREERAGEGWGREEEGSGMGVGEGGGLERHQQQGEQQQQHRRQREQEYHARQLPDGAEDLAHREDPWAHHLRGAITGKVHPEDTTSATTPETSATPKTPTPSDASATLLFHPDKPTDVLLPRGFSGEHDDDDGAWMWGGDGEAYEREVAMGMETGMYGGPGGGR